MANLMELLQGELSEGILNQIGSSVGADKEQTENAVESAMTAILSGLSKNVQKPEGASSLLGALDRDHDGSILDDLAGFVGGKQQKQQAAIPQMFNGAGILKHVLGGKQSNVIDTISKVTGLDSGKSGQMLLTLAPVIMGMLGKMKKTHNVSNNNLLDLITQSSSNQQANSGLGGLFTKMLDKDGDGNVMDDIAGMGVKSLLGGLFKR